MRTQPLEASPRSLRNRIFGRVLLTAVPSAVVAAYVISTVPDPRKVLLEMIRVCKENGRIVLLNHFSNGNKLMAIVERLISPLCVHIGFRTDLALEPLLEGMPLVIQKKAHVNPLRFWHLVQFRKANGNGGYHQS